MRPLTWLPLALALCMVGCSRPAGTTSTGTPSAPAVPAADPIVGKWEVAGADQPPITFVFTADKRMAIDQERTRTSLLSMLEKRAASEAGRAEDTKIEAMKKATAVVDQQMKEFKNFSATWEKQGALYKLVRVGGDADTSWIKIEDNKLVSTDENGKPQPDQLVATRV